MLDRRLRHAREDRPDGLINPQLGVSQAKRLIADPALRRALEAGRIDRRPSLRLLTDDQEP
jgi:hypothetical protein